MKDILNEITWAYQRVVRGYDDRVFWGFEGYFITVIPALKWFCEKQLGTTATTELNPERHKIFTETLRLIKEWDVLPYWDTDGNNQSRVSKLLVYVCSNIEYFWD